MFFTCIYRIGCSIVLGNVWAFRGWKLIIIYISMIFKQLFDIKVLNMISWDKFQVQHNLTYFDSCEKNVSWWEIMMFLSYQMIMPIFYIRSFCVHLLFCIFWFGAVLFFSNILNLLLFYMTLHKYYTCCYLWI